MHIFAYCLAIQASNARNGNEKAILEVCLLEQVIFPCSHLSHSSHSSTPAMHFPTY